MPYKNILLRRENQRRRYWLNCEKESLRKKASYDPERNRQRYLENRQEVLLKAKEYSRTHPEVFKEKYRKLKLLNIPKTEEQVQHAKEYQIQYYTKHREQVLERTKQYQKDNPGIGASVRIRRRRIINTVDRDESRRINVWMREIKSKPFVRCHWCGTKIHGRRIHFDHIIALVNQGTHTIGNLCCACDDCNLKKNARAISDWIVNGQRFLL